ncbi:hypothetical protein [Bradyrhizobium sp. SZCCHNS3053]|uniref:hypothetical protein n=1 Tax=Bradyrhizobium sp. SZCCHNS3053 TaxID=3057322 RepID=UPI002916CAAF|nr:hypothetical protein [Bradyrhizobium sp. SZCCHNS3053]
MSTTFVASVSIDARKVADQIVTAIEGGSGYWMNSFKPEGEITTKVSPWYDDENIWSGEFKIRVEVDGEDEPKFLTPESIRNGLNWLAQKHAWRIDQIVNESGDAETADVFIQVCLFGDIVYG